MWTIKAFIKSCCIDSRNEQSQVVHETNKAHFRNPPPNRFLPSSVGRELEWWSGGCEFKLWGQFLTKFILSRVASDLADNLTETPYLKNSSVSRQVVLLDEILSRKLPSHHPLIFRTVWILCVVTAIVFFIYQVSDRAMTYLDYNTTVSVNIQYTNQVPFPAVTLCNINSYRYV